MAGTILPQKERQFFFVFGLSAEMKLFACLNFIHVVTHKQKVREQALPAASFNVNGVKILKRDRLQSWEIPRALHELLRSTQLLRILAAPSPFIHMLNVAACLMVFWKSIPDRSELSYFAFFVSSAPLISFLTLAVGFRWFR